MPSAVRLRTDFTARELRRLAKKAKDVNQSRRLLSLAAVLNDMSRTEAAMIGGMDRRFKLKLFYTLHAAEQAGLSPGITSAFRDDYRQSIASGLRAATDRSYHGGSFRRGYGHGLAADVVSINGATEAQRLISNESLWKWIDAHRKEFGIGRPYLDKDPPHLAPIDGKEYVAHRGTRAQYAESDMKNHKRLAVRVDHSVAKTSRKRKMAALQRS